MSTLLKGLKYYYFVHTQYPSISKKCLLQSKRKDKYVLVDPWIIGNADPEQNIYKAPEVIRTKGNTNINYFQANLYETGLLLL